MSQGLPWFQDRRCSKESFTIELAAGRGTSWRWIYDLQIGARHFMFLLPLLLLSFLRSLA